MGGNAAGKLPEIIFERLVAGEDESQLRLQLGSQLEAADVDRLIEDARSRIEKGRGDAQFERHLRKIRRRRLVGQRYQLWKVLACFLILSSGLSCLFALMDRGRVIGSIGGILIGGIILAMVEWREQSILNPLSDPADNSGP